MSNNGRLIEYTGPNSGYLIRVRGDDVFVTVATRRILRDVENYVRRLVLHANIPIEDIRVYRQVEGKKIFR